MTIVIIISIEKILKDGTRSLGPASLSILSMAIGYILFR